MTGVNAKALTLTRSPSVGFIHLNTHQPGFHVFMQRASEHQEPGTHWARSCHLHRHTDTFLGGSQSCSPRHPRKVGKKRGPRRPCDSGRQQQGLERRLVLLVGTKQGRALARLVLQGVSVPRDVRGLFASVRTAVFPERGLPF